MPPHGVHPPPASSSRRSPAPSSSTGCSPAPSSPSRSWPTTSACRARWCGRPCSSWRRTRLVQAGAGARRLRRGAHGGGSAPGVRGAPLLEARDDARLRPQVTPAQIAALREHMAQEKAAIGPRRRSRAPAAAGRLPRLHRRTDGQRGAGADPARPGVAQSLISLMYQRDSFAAHSQPSTWRSSRRWRRSARRARPADGRAPAARGGEPAARPQPPTHDVHGPRRQAMTTTPPRPTRATWPATAASRRMRGGRATRASRCSSS